MIKYVVTYCLYLLCLILKVFVGLILLSFTFWCYY